VSLTVKLVLPHDHIEAVHVIVVAVEAVSTAEPILHISLSANHADIQ